MEGLKTDGLMGNWIAIGSYTPVGKMVLNILNCSTATGGTSCCFS
ncbi:hypothetical protein [Kaarinaea lacus]